ncbi:MAG: ABC transporter substrate-binding protein [Nocardioidaceae bacterium]|nr:ABC transporter substrate-binding protein [Nocardioidaceae bacterium]
MWGDPLDEEAGTDTDAETSSDAAPSSDEAPSSDGGSEEKGELTIGGQDFTEMQVMASMYEQLLSNAGYDVTTKLVTTRDVYVGELSKGNVDVVPDYLAGMTDYLHTLENGEDAPPVSTNDPEETLKALDPLVEEQGISMLEPAEATDQNAFIVTEEFAQENSLTTLSDLGALGEPIKLAAPATCEGRSDCAKGLIEVYGIDISEIVPLEFASAQMKDALKTGEVQLGETGTTDGSLDSLGLVLLEDDKGIQPAQNLIPAVNSDFLEENPDVADVLNELSATLTTEDLTNLNLQVDLERQQPEDVAQAYLEEKGLL